jgi:hypothetical protein
VCAQPNIHNPDGDCTLREAINAANDNDNDATATDTIAFDITGNGPHSIIVGGTGNLEPLRITEPVIIDGYTQGDDTATTADDATENTATGGSTNAVLRIELFGGSSAAEVNGLDIDAPNVVVRGLAINGWRDRGIDISVGGSGTVIEGNFIGTNVFGDTGLPNRRGGVDIINASGVRVGGTDADDGAVDGVVEARNLISGNGNVSNVSAGVRIFGDAATGNKVEGNLIGTDNDGTNDLGNTGAGVEFIAASNNTVGGGASSGAANVIAFNGRDGVTVNQGTGKSTGNRILNNSIFDNDQLGIDLLGQDLANGITPNDLPKDADTGSNNLQNFPVLTSATTDGTTTTITGTLNSLKKKTFTIQFFSSDAADPSGNGEGKTFLGEITVKTNRKGFRSFSAQVDAPPAGENSITATATNRKTGDTSEFSQAVTVG